MQIEDRRVKNEGSLRRSLTPEDIARMVVVAVLYFLAGKVGLKLASINKSASAVWPPTGIALSAILLLGYRASPAIWIGAFLTNITTTGTWISTFGIATGNTLEAVVGAYLVNRYANGRRAFDKPEDVFRFVFLAGLASTTISATCGVASLLLTNQAAWSNVDSVWLTWWLGDVGGNLVIAPMLNLCTAPQSVKWNGGKIKEAGAFLATPGLGNLNAIENPL